MNKNLKIGIIIGVVFCIIMIALIILNSNNKSYTIKFDSNDGTIVESQTIKKGEKVIKPIDPTKEGYKFVGWYADGNKYDFNDIVKKSFILRAKWTNQDEEKKFIITFDTNGGSIINNIEVVDGQKIVKPVEPSKDGYIFVEWLLNNNTFNFEQEITSDINLVASWKELEQDMFTVIFDSKGGNSITTQTIKKDEKALKPNDPIREGYRFDGWYLKNKKYNFNTKITDNITLVANWTSIQIDNQPQTNTQPNTPQTEQRKYSVVFDSDGGEAINSIEVLENNTITNLPSTKKKDYEFNGWYLDGVNFTTTTLVSSNITLKAQYTFLNSEKQMHEGYPKPDIAYSYSTVESGQKYLDLLNSLWDNEVSQRLDKGFYSQEEIDNYLDYLDNKAYEYKEVLECLPEHEDMCN